jgi:hypothetical protein
VKKVVGKAAAVVFVVGVICLLLGMRLMGGGAVTAQGDAQSAQSLVAGVREFVFNQCKSERVNRIAAEKSRLALVNLADTIMAQPAQLVDPAARESRTKKLERIVAPLRKPLATPAPCSLPSPSP